MKHWPDDCTHWEPNEGLVYNYNKNLGGDSLTTRYSDQCKGMALITMNLHNMNRLRKPTIYSNWIIHNNAYYYAICCRSALFSPVIRLQLIMQLRFHIVLFCVGLQCDLMITCACVYIGFNGSIATEFVSTGDFKG